MMEVNIMNPDHCNPSMPRTQFSVLGSVLCDEEHIVALQRTLLTSKIEKNQLMRVLPMPK